MTKDIIPPKDGDFNTFQNNVIAAMVANALLWLIPNGVITALQGLQTTWTNAYRTYNDPAQRTAGVTTAKNEARSNFELQFRPAVQQYVQRNSIVTDQQRIDVGIKPIDRTRTPVAPPGTVPLLALKGGNGSQVRFHFTQGPDENGVSRRGKPAGVSRVQVVFKIGDPAPVGAVDCPVGIRRS